MTSLPRRSQRLSKRERWNRPTDIPPRTGLRFDAGLLGQRRHGLCRLPVDQLLQLLAGLEVGDALGRHVHSVAGPGVAAAARLAAPETETAEAAEFDLLALLQRRHDVAEHGVDDDFGALLREAGGIGHLLDERRLRKAAFGVFV